MKEEVWKPISEYEGLYEVSNYGRIKSYGRNKKGKILSSCFDCNNYEVCTLFSNGKRKREYIQKLVAIQFVPNTNNYYFIAHKDGNKANNNAENLKWIKMPNPQNLKPIKNPYPIELCWEANRKAVKCITTGEIYKSLTEASRQKGVDRSSIIKCCKGKMKTAGKLKWEYAYEVENEN